MKACKIRVRLITLVAAVCCMAAGARADESTTITVSPSTLSFGVPTGSTTSAQDTAVFSVTGSGSVILGTVNITGTNQSDFVITSDACSGQTLTAPAACIVGVTFKGAMTTLETAMLNFPNNLTESPGQTVALTGAFGAIKLFDPVYEAVSNPNATPGTLLTFNRTTLALSCPSSPTATFSSSPDGSGYVFVDNFLALNFGNTSPGTSTGTLTTNVCPGNLGNPSDGGQPDCFTSAYQGPAAAGDLTGMDPDTFTNPGNTNPFLDGAPGGVPPINVASQFANQSTTPTATVSMLDDGGFVGSSTLFLVTDCTPTGVQNGGSITGSTINPNSPASLVPQFTFNGNQNEHISFSANYLTGQNNITFPPGISPTVADIGIPQSVFSSYVAGTSAGPAVCLRDSGEVDADGNALCKGFLLQCTASATDGTLAGDNCPQSPNARDIMFSAAFNTPDALTIRPFTGPGLLMGSDNWTSAASCVFVGLEAGQLCPQSLLTQFKGAGDPVGGGTTRGSNSIFVAVINMPLPITLPLVTSENIFGWQRNTMVNLKFIASPAIYPILNPLPANGFTPAPILSETFGTTSANVAVPDTTFPIPTDVSLFNADTTVPPGICTSSTPGGLFTATDTITNDTSTGNTLMEGRYNLHYFATDCASTEELAFQPSNNPNVNWAKFKSVPINIDMTPPTLTVVSATRSGNTVTIKYSCTDPDLKDGTEGSGVVICGTFLFFAVDSTPTLTSKFTLKPGNSVTLTTTDLAGNTRSVTLTP
jgi:hypothetical protein